MKDDEAGRKSKSPQSQGLFFVTAITPFTLENKTPTRLNEP